MTAPLTFRDLLGPRCIDDAEQLKRYEIPERGAPGHASCVLLPETESEIGAILRVANEHALKLVISAGRTGLVEAQRPQGEAVLSLERLTQIGGIDAANASVTVEAGVAIDALNAALEPHGLMFPIEMGSSSAATVGACVANASAGANAVCYGTAAHMCETAWGWSGSGDWAEPSHAQPWPAPTPDQLAIDSARIRPEWGLIGAQGILGIITRVQLRLQRIPTQREGALIPVADMPTAMAALAAARAEFGGDVEEFEFISRSALELVRALRGGELRLPFTQSPDAPWFLLLQIKAHDDSDLAGRLYTFLSERLRLPDEQVGYAPLAALKHIRHSITEASTARMRSLGGGRLAFDTATPLTQFGVYLNTLEHELAAIAPQVQLVAFGHAGIGGAHLHLLGIRDQPVSERAQELIARVFDITGRYGGTFSAEHGVGSKWADEYWRRTPRAELDELIALKHRYDPKHVLNPRCFGLDRA